MPTALELAIDAIYRQDATTLEKATAHALLVGYDRRWRNQEWRAVQIEETFHCPIVNPDSGVASRTYTYAGKCDAIVTNGSNRQYLREMKTSSEDIADPSSTFWRRVVNIDTQISLYMLAHWQNEQKLDGTLYDVVRKPSIRPKQITKAARACILNGEYCGHEVPAEVVRAVRAGQESECETLYRLRLTADVLKRPSYYYQRRTVPRLDSDLEEFAGELWDIAKEIRGSELNDRWFRNSAACMAYGRPCEYLGICSGYDDEHSDKWARSAHHEEFGEEFPRLHVLTHSSMQTYKTCRRKYYFRYVRGLDHAERPSTLRFGSLLHDALAAWWSAHQE